MSLAELMGRMSRLPAGLFVLKKKKTFLFCVNCHHDVCLCWKVKKTKKEKTTTTTNVEEICAPFGKMNERDTDERHAVEPSADCSKTT